MPLGKRSRATDDAGGLEAEARAEARARNAGGRNPNNGFLPGNKYMDNEGQRLFPKCLLGLPDNVLARIFSDVLVQHQPIAVQDNVMDLVPRERVALLGTCVRFRKLACPIFYACNDFTIEVKDFDARASMRWWNKVQAVRKEEKDNRQIRVGSVSSRYMPPSDTIFTKFWRPSMETRVQQYWESMVSGRDTDPLVHGTITVDVDYAPNWINLKHWLHSYFEGQLPRYTVPLQNTSNELKGIEIAFDLMQAYEHQPWTQAARCLRTIRASLALQHKDWAIKDSGAASAASPIEEIEDDDEVTANEDVQEAPEELMTPDMVQATQVFEALQAPFALDTTADSDDDDATLDGDDVEADEASQPVETITASDNEDTRLNRDLALSPSGWVPPTGKFPPKGRSSGLYRRFEVLRNATSEEREGAQSTSDREAAPVCDSPATANASPEHMSDTTLSPRWVAPKERLSGLFRRTEVEPKVMEADDEAAQSSSILDTAPVCNAAATTSANEEHVSDPSTPVASLSSPSYAGKGSDDEFASEWV